MVQFIGRRRNVAFNDLQCKNEYHEGDQWKEFFKE